MPVVETHEGVDPSIDRAAPFRSSILVVPSRTEDELARLHRYAYTRLQYGLVVDSVEWVLIPQSPFT